MPFDYQAATKAGKTKQEIIQYLATSRNVSQATLDKQWLPKGEDFTIRALSRFKPQEQVDTTVKPEETGGVLGFLGKVIGGEKLARGIGARLASLGGDYQKNVQAAVDAGELTEEQANQLSIGGVNAKQMLGSAIETAATVATLGVGSAAVKGIKGAAITGAKLAGTGAAAGFGAGLVDNKNIGESLKQAFTTGLTTAATAGVFSALGKLGKVALERLPVKLYASAAKLEKEVANTMMNEGQMGTLAKLKAIADNQIDDISNTITSKIANKNGTFVSKDFLQRVVGDIKGKWQGASIDEIKTALRKWKIDPFLSGKKVDFLTVDNIRKGLGTELRTVWKMEGSPKFNKDVGLTLWKEIVNTIRPSTDTITDFKRFSDYISASNKLGSILKNQDKKFGLSLSDLLVGGIGLGGGGATGVGAVIAKKAIESPIVKTATAVGLNKMNTLIDKIPAKYFDKAGRISRTALVSALKEMGNTGE